MTSSCLFIVLCIISFYCVVVYCGDVLIIGLGHRLDRERDRSYNETCEQSDDCGSQNFICLDGWCKCATGYFPILNQCVRCPTVGQICKGCCAEGLVCDQNLCQYAEDDPLTFAVSQIALGLALIFGISALATLIWKICFPPYRRRREARASGTSVNSVNSIQRLVNERMQNRPPSYVDSVDGCVNNFNTTMVPQTCLRNVPQYRAEAPPMYSVNCPDGTIVIIPAITDTKPNVTEPNNTSRQPNEEVNTYM